MNLLSRWYRVNKIIRSAGKCFHTPLCWILFELCIPLRIPFQIKSRFFLLLTYGFQRLYLRAGH